jgi:monofunctional glycosyltransferase
MLSRFVPRLPPWFLVSAAILLALACWSGWRCLTLPDVSVLKDRRTTLTIQVRDWQGREHPFLLGPRNPAWTPLAEIPEALQWAVIVAEDANFYSHDGIDVPAIEEALKYDLEKKRLAHGASTITQQLAKNLFLSRRKSLVRKVEEMVLARRLEKELSKGRILELYLNVVELGPLVYGVGEGARYHFHQPVAELNPAQCAFLAAILPGPRVAYNPALRPRKVRRRAEHILRLLDGRGVLDAEGYTTARADLEDAEGAPVRKLPALAPEKDEGAGTEGAGGPKQPGPDETVAVGEGSAPGLGAPGAENPPFQPEG